MNRANFTAEFAIAQAQVRKAWDASHAAEQKYAAAKLDVKDAKKKMRRAKNAWIVAWAAAEASQHLVNTMRDIVCEQEPPTEEAKS